MLASSQMALNGPQDLTRPPESRSKISSVDVSVKSVDAGISIGVFVLSTLTCWRRIGIMDSFSLTGGHRATQPAKNVSSTDS